MPLRLLYCHFLYLGLLVFHLPIAAQSGQAGLFDDDTVLQLKLYGNVRELFNDRGDDPQYYPLVLSYNGGNGSETLIALKAKTRGHFRKEKANCTYPPILLNFQNSKKEATLFEDQNKVKLVTSCRGDKYVIREYLVYKLYNLLTPKSLRARLVQTTFYDTVRKKSTTCYGILLEEDQQMAMRNGLKVLKVKRMPVQSTELETFLKLAVFQYMIGNTDWSVEYLHNIKTVAFDSLSIPSVVPYDFDHAGIVDAPYALPAQQLALRSVHERRYRGYCMPDMRAFDKVVAIFNFLKADFYQVYTGCTLLDKKYIASTLKYLDEFYEVLNNSKKLHTEFSYPCNKSATQFVIGGLGVGETDD